MAEYVAEITEIVHAIKNDQQLQRDPSSTGDWCRTSHDGALRALSPPPPPTPVDLSVLVESGIDCEFSDGSATYRDYGPLVGIGDDGVDCRYADGARYGHE